MKFKDLEVGMVVAIGTRDDLLNGDAECAVVLDIGGWNDRDANGGSLFHITTRPKSRFHKGGGKGVAVLTSHEKVRRHFDGKKAGRPRWYPAVVGANRIACTWEKALAIYGNAHAVEMNHRREALDRRLKTKALARNLARMGVGFDLNEYRNSITLNQDEMKELFALLLDLMLGFDLNEYRNSITLNQDGMKELSALLLDLMPGSMLKARPELVIHCEAFRPGEALCGVTGVGKLGKADLDKVAVSYRHPDEVTCPACLAVLDKEKSAA